MASWDPAVPGHPGEAGPGASRLMMEPSPVYRFQGHLQGAGDPQAVGPILGGPPHHTASKLGQRWTGFRAGPDIP